MAAILVRLWPILIPIILYIVWYFFLRNKKDEERLSEKEAKLWIWILISSLIIAIICIIVLFFSLEENTEGTYIPPEYRNGEIIPGRIIPKK